MILVFNKMLINVLSNEITTQEQHVHKLST